MATLSLYVDCFSFRILPLFTRGRASSSVLSSGSFTSHSLFSSLANSTPDNFLKVNSFATKSGVENFSSHVWVSYGYLYLYNYKENYFTLIFLYFVLTNLFAKLTTKKNALSSRECGTTRRKGTLSLPTYINFRDVNLKM